MKRNRREENAKTRYMLTGRGLHPMAAPIADRFRAGRITRREYPATMAGLGVSAARAIALRGLPAPAAAQRARPNPAACCASRWR